MKLCYRGTHYELPTQTSFDAHSSNPNPQTSPQKQLIYRGTAYPYNPQASILSEASIAPVQIVTLMYRGQTYTRQLPNPLAHPSASMSNHWKPSEAQA